MHFKSIDMPIDFDALWHAAGVSKSLAQNWTNGRPLRVVPSLSQGRGKGSRHVYALADAYLLAFLHLVKRNGLSDEFLRKIADIFNIWGVGDSSTAIRSFSEQNHWLEVNVTKLVVSIAAIPYDPTASTHLLSYPLQLNDVHDLIGIKVAVNLTKLRDEVNQRLETYVAKPDGEGRSNGRKLPR